MVEKQISDHKLVSEYKSDNISIRKMHDTVRNELYWQAEIAKTIDPNFASDKIFNIAMPRTRARPDGSRIHYTALVSGKEISIFVDINPDKTSIKSMGYKLDYMMVDPQTKVRFMLAKGLVETTARLLDEELITAMLRI